MSGILYSFRMRQVSEPGGRISAFLREGAGHGIRRSDPPASGRWPVGQRRAAAVIAADGAAGAAQPARRGQRLCAAGQRGAAGGAAWAWLLRVASGERAACRAAGHVLRIAGHRASRADGPVPLAAGGAGISEAGLWLAAVGMAGYRGPGGGRAQDGTDGAADADGLWGHPGTCAAAPSAGGASAPHHTHRRAVRTAADDGGGHPGAGPDHPAAGAARRPGAAGRALQRFPGAPGEAGRGHACGGAAQRRRAGPAGAG